MDQNRYKQRSAKFSSAQDARVVRALASKVDRRSQRDRGMLGRRNLDISEELEDSSLLFQSVPETKPEPKKTYEEMQDELYQQLLIYKSDKKTRVEKEKQCRLPVFHTGGFTPDKPKFLIGIDSDNFSLNKSENSKISPFKFMRSSTRSGGSSATKVFKFRSGATPNMASKEIKNTAPCKSPELAKRRILAESGLLNIPAGHTAKETLRKLGGMKPSWMQMSNKTRAQSRMNAVTKEQIRLETAEEELGVAALPSSPADNVAFSEATVNTSKSFSSRNRKSFAPDDFKFGFKGLVAHIKAKAMGIMEETENKTEKDIPIKEIKNKLYESVKEKNIEVMKEEDNIAEETCSKEEIKADRLDNFVMSSDKDSIVKENEITSEAIPDKFTSKITESKSDLGDQHSNFKDYVKDDYTKEIVEPASVGETDCIKYENKENGEEKYPNVFTSHGVTNVCEDSVEMMDIDENSENVNTPSQNNKLEVFSAHKSRRRSSVGSFKGSLSCTPSKRHSSLVKSCCNTGSPMSRLRPRTPCSRSTRRSIAAHTDPLNLSFTPGRRSSTRRSIRRSRAVSLKDEEKSSASPIKLYASPALPEVKGTHVEDESCQDNTSNIKISTTEVSASKQQVAPNNINHKQSSSQSKDTPTDNNNKTDTTQFVTPSENITGSVSRRKRGGRVSWMVECSPFITSRDSSKKERRSVSRINADLTGLFDDIPTDGSPLPDYLMKSALGTSDVIATGDSSALSDRDNDGHPAVEAVSDICTNLLPLLQPTTPEKYDDDSLHISVWDEETPTDTPVTLSEAEDSKMVAAHNPIVSDSLPHTQSQETPQNMIQPEIHQKQEEVFHSPSRLSTLKTPGRRKSRRAVMFAKDSTNTENSGIRYPGTPIRNTTRVSMGLFSAVDVNTTDPNISPSQNLMAFESPKSERKAKGSRRSSVRMSLLPVVETPFTGQQSDGTRRSQTTEDLISWVSPTTNKRKSKGADLATPRRSRRMSKAIVE